MQKDIIPIKTVVTFFKNLTSWIIEHKYLVTIAALASLILFLDEKSICKLWIPTMVQNAKLEKEKQYYLEKIHNDSIMLHELKTNDENLIRFAREQYHMKATNEDIYIIMEQE